MEIAVGKKYTVDLNIPPSYADFCGQVCRQVKHATPEEKKGIVQELADHLEDHAQALMALGRDEAEARASAVAAMGDPEEIGRELDKEFPFIWLFLSRVPAFITGILVLILILPFLNQCYLTYHNLYARISPASRYMDSCSYMDHLIDIRMEVPESGDIVRYFSADVIKKEGNYVAMIGVCCYDKCIFGLASDNVLRYINYESIEPNGFTGGSGFSNGGAAYQIRQVPVAYGTESVTATYDRCGIYWQVEIPLDWEGIT